MKWYLCLGSMKHMRALSHIYAYASLYMHINKNPIPNFNVGPVLQDVQHFRLIWTGKQNFGINVAIHLFLIKAGMQKVKIEKKICQGPKNFWHKWFQEGVAKTDQEDSQFKVTLCPLLRHWNLNYCTMFALTNMIVNYYWMCYVNNLGIYVRREKSLMLPLCLCD